MSGEPATIVDQINALKPWHQKLSFGGGVISPGLWDPQKQAREIAGWLPGGISGKSVLDIGSNAGGVGVEMSLMGAASVTLVEKNVQYHAQAELFINHIKQQGIKALNTSAFSAHTLPSADIVLWLGLIYHFRHPQLFLDYAAGVGGEYHIFSTQVVGGFDLMLSNRKWKYPDHPQGLLGWEPSRETFLQMLQLSGYKIIEFYDRSGTDWTNNFYVVCTPPKMAAIDVAVASQVLDADGNWF